MIRLFLVPVLIVVSWQGHAWLFLGLLCFAFFTDALDGFIARTFHQQTKIGAKLDSLADFVIYMTIPICAWLLWPEVIRQQFVFVIAIIGSILLPVLIGVIKFGSYPSYHTWLTKLAAISMAVTSVLLFLGGNAVMFRIAACLCMLAAVEEIIITFILEKPQSNVRSLFHVLKQRHKQA